VLLATRNFDLVLSDIKMPDKTGYDVFAAARKKSQTAGDSDDRIRLRPQPLHRPGQPGRLAGGALQASKSINSFKPSNRVMIVQTRVTRKTAVFEQV
jgi:CheY-like chemotaxis protein